MLTKKEIKRASLLAILVISFTLTSQFDFIKQVKAQENIVVDDADEIVEFDLINSTSLDSLLEIMDPSIIVEYVDTLMENDLLNSSSLDSLLEIMDPSIIVEYVDTLMENDLLNSSSLDSLLEIMDPSIIVEYLDALIENNLLNSSELDNLIKPYNFDDDPRFLKVFLINKWFDVGDIDINIRLKMLLPKENDGTLFKEAVESWGVELYDYQDIPFCYLLEIGNLTEFFDFLQSKIPNIITNEIMDYIYNFYCYDGYARIVFTSMSNIELTLNDLADLANLFKSLDEITVIDTPIYDKYKDILIKFFSRDQGTNQYKTQLALKDGFKIFDVIYFIAEKVIESYNVEMSLIIIDKGSISSKTFFDMRKGFDKIKFCVDSFKLIYKLCMAALQGGANPLTDLQFASKAFTYYMDYVVHYNLGNNQYLDFLYQIAEFFDPPTARIDLQIRDLDTNQILLGFNPINNETINYFNQGFLVGNLFSKFLFLNLSLFPVNLTIINTHLNSSEPLIFLNQTLSFGITNSTSTESIFTYLSSNSLFYTILNYSETRGLLYNLLKLKIHEVDENSIKVNITDNNGSYVEDVSFKILYREEEINATILNQEEGIYEIIPSLDFKHKEILILVEKEGYLSSSKSVILTNWAIEGGSNPLNIPSYDLFILIVMYLGVSCIFLKNKKFDIN
ncbi:MAG: hypothetical protein EU541_08360 [Promethearchaeota archaeon]|nr:MAG: hypothetical protein EU541_08360 [Candidatus Lokiarchaeota archaeon]